MKRDLFVLYLLLPAVLFFSGCQAALTSTAKVTTQAEKAGVIRPSTAKSIKKSTDAVAKTQEEFTPEQEYYIGRSVAAVILNKYPPYMNQPANEYLNLIGQTLAQVSEMPEIFRGYRVLVLNSNEINAFATPGGHIFITKGLLRCCRTDDAVAAVLAHGSDTSSSGTDTGHKAQVAEAVSDRHVSGDKLATFGGAITDIRT
jgi:predicted Zn-dependent protease